MSNMPRFEVRYEENSEWIEITELQFMDGLYKSYRRISPVIKEMINGKELRTPDGAYRIKLTFTNPRMTDIVSNHASSD